MKQLKRVEIDQTTDIESLIALFGVVFEQVKLQQEVRDRWFEHYISIIGAISALAALCFGYYQGLVDDSSLMMILSSIFLFAGIIGILFYLLYVRQRLNYLKEYKEIIVITNRIYGLLFTTSERQQMQSQFKKKKRGADYITLLIENLICSVSIGLSILFASFSQGLSIVRGLCLFLIAVVAMGLLLLKIDKKMEEEI